MLILEIEYLSYLCQTSRTINSHLLNLYTRYSDNHHENVNRVYVDNELDNFLIELIESTEYWSGIENAKYYDSFVKNYYRLDDLIRYMYDVDCLMKKHGLMLEEKRIRPSKFSGYQLEDSRLLSFEVDSAGHTCSMILKGVMVYNDKCVPVDAGTILIKFIDTQKIDVKGEIKAMEPDVHNVYRWCMIETEDKLSDFNLLVLVGHRQFLLQVISSDIEVSRL